MAFEALSATAGLKVLDKLTADVYEAGKATFAKTLANWRLQSTIQTAFDRIGRVRFVKTVWQPATEIDLLSFYCPTRLTINHARKVIHDLADVEHDGNILIEGTVGQGKSIFCRYLVYAELQKGAVALPVFFELSRFRDGETLTSHLVAEISSYGFSIDERLLHFMAETGHLILFLDSFDEVKDSRRQQLVTEIDQLARLHPRLRIAITSRPNCAITYLPSFRVFQLAELQGREYEVVLRKLSQDPTTANELIEALASGGSRIATFLTTPLMIGLLIFKYATTHTFPETEVELFGDIFDLLMRRQDKSKPGFVRQRKSNLGVSTLLAIFNRICFLCSTAKERDHSIGAMRKYATKAIADTKATCDPDAALEDIIEITCLILEEGGHCRFVHKSIQEYHAAEYVKDLLEPHAKTFYGKMQTEWESWQQVLVFLEQIDKYRFVKWFEIPDRRWLLRLAQDAPVPDDALTTTALDACCHAYHAELDVVHPDVRYRFAGGGYPKAWVLRNQMKSLLDSLFQVLDGHADQIALAVSQGKVRHSKGSLPILVKINLAEMMSIPSVQKDLRQVLRPVYDREAQCLRDSYQYIDEAEDSQIVREL